MEATATHISRPVTNYQEAKKTIVKEQQSGLLKRHKVLVLWIGFHLIAWALAALQWPFFNNTGEPQVEKFWPLIKFTEKRFTMVQTQPVEVWETTSSFNGLFSQYDWTEFVTYVGLVLFGILLSYVNKKTS
jgi:hypothetical protein